MSHQPRTRSIDAEGAIVGVRWFALAFAVIQTLTYYRPIPAAVVPWAIGVLVVFGVVTVALTFWWWHLPPTRASGGDRRPARSRRLFGVISLVVDTSFAIALTWIYAFDVDTAIFAVLYLPPLEAAIRYGMRGAVATVAAATVAYTARDLWAEARYGHPFLLPSVSFRMGIGLLVAFIGGAMADRYEREHERVVGALARERSAANALRSLDDLRSTFLAAVSHELRTPLTSILGFSLTIQQHAPELEPRTRLLLDHVVAEGRQLEHLLQDLLDIERTGRGGVTLDRVPVDLAQIARRLATRLESRVGRHVEVPEQSVGAVVDAGKAERIIDNLLSNAVKYSPEGTEVRVRMEHSGDGVIVVVEDEGPGVPMALRSSIFAPFERGHITSAHQPGTGIGLSIVDRFARLHGGRAWVQDRDDARGSAFHVYLPNGPEGASIATVDQGR